MLTYKISARDIKYDVQPIGLNSRIVHIDDEAINISASNCGLRKSDTVTFVRNNGDNIHYTEDVSVLAVSENSISVPRFPEKLLPIYNAGVIEMKFHPYKNKRNFLTLLLTGGEHDFVQYRKDDRYGDDAAYIREHIYGDYSEYIESMKRCDNDFVLYEDTFLYKASVDAATGKYSFNGAEDGFPVANTVENTNAFIYIRANGSLADYISEHNTGGDSWNVMEDGRICLENCIIPVNKNGQNNRAVILWEARDTELASKIAENAQISTFNAEDVRFIKWDNYLPQKGDFSLTDGTILQKVSYSAIFSEPVLQDIGTNLFQEDAIKTKYINNVIDSFKNGIIDYEKKCFTPVYFDNDGEKDVEEIKFNLHFRKRTVEDAENSVGYTYGDWKTADNLFWNNYSKNGDKLVPKDGLTDEDADLLGYLGFTDEDVIRERNRIGRSFLRLSFYNTPDRRTQKLLFTSTLFMNTGKYYEQYSTNVRGSVLKNGKPKNANKIENQYVYTENAVPRLSAAFSCRDKYSTTSSSEGFYLYLFPGLLDENGRGTIYMKAEFSHAKYGYTIPFIMPVDSNNDPIRTDSEDFPMRYVTTNTDGKQYIDTTRLFNDMYIKVNIEYDSDKRRYIWYLPNRKWNANPSFNLFEPRINAGEDFIVYVQKTDGITASGETILGIVSCGHEQTWRAILVDPTEGWSISPNNGTGETPFTIIIPENTSVESKSYEVKFTCGGEENFVILNQLFPNYNFSVDTSGIAPLSWDGDYATFTINDEDNYGWNIPEVSPFVSSISARSGCGSAEIRFTVSQNNTENERQVSIVVEDTKYHQLSTVLATQEHFTADWWFDEEESGVLSWENAEFAPVLCDTEALGYIVETTLPYWIELQVGDNGDGYYYFFFYVDENPLLNEREASIVIKDGTYGILKRTITITQEGCMRGNVKINVTRGRIRVEMANVDFVETSWEVNFWFEKSGIVPPGGFTSGNDYGVTSIEYGPQNVFTALPVDQGGELWAEILLDMDITSWDGASEISKSYSTAWGWQIPLGNVDGTDKEINVSLPNILVDRYGEIGIDTI